MDIQIRNRAARFSDLNPGSLFCALRAERIFGLCIADPGGTGAFLFSQAPAQQRVPWLASGGLPNDDLVSFPGAVIRADPLSVSPVTGPIPFGAVINFEDKFYMRGARSLGSFVTCDLL